jgi:hypothetical protein
VCNNEWREEGKHVQIKSLGIAIFTVVLVFFIMCNEKSDILTGATGSNKAYGVFELYMDQSRNQVTFSGKLKTGPQPMVLWDTVMVSGECVLLKARSRSCEGCGLGFVCVDNNDCRREPDTLTAGTITVSGYSTRGGTTTTGQISAINGNYQPLANDRPDNPPCVEGGTITVTASGNDMYEGFSLSAKTISKIVTSLDPIMMNPGEDIHLKWDAAKNFADSRMEVSVDVSYHATTKARIVCDCLDDGELTIPARMLDSLKTFGMAGFPKLELFRKSIGSSPATGVQLSLQAYVLLWLNIPGLISCSGDKECPDGTTCENHRCVEVQK